MPTVIEVRVNPEKTRARLIVRLDDELVCDVPLEPEDVVDAVHKIGNARAAIAEVPFDTEPVGKYREVDNPTWRIPNYTDGGDRLLLLRHPAMGWTSFRLPQKEANSMAEWLTKKVDNRPRRSTQARGH
jgi:hypothetical protein